MPDLYKQLRDLRKRIADQEGVEVFRVFNNATIDEMCAKLPKTLEELLEVKGMGEKKVGKYGGQILRVLNQELGVMSQEGQIPNDKFQISNQDAKTDSGLPATVQGDSFVQAESVSANSPHLASPWKGEEPDRAKQLVSVSEYVDYLNLVLQKTADVKIVGEVSGSKMYPSGFYFTLKDKTDETALSCYLPIYTYRDLGIPIEDGMEVSVEGMPRMVKRNGRFQFTVENVELVGEGALKKAYDLLKAKLEAEGLFARKRELPEFVTSVGIITSRAGAVIHDFRSNLAKLGIKVYLKDVRVEGASSVAMVVEAVRWFNNLETLSVQNTGHLHQRGRVNAPDVIVIMRGGGSMEDLQGFNSEAVVRAVFGSRIPTIVSIGHDKDVPLAQLVADVMVSTPTAAAHAVSATWNRLIDELPRQESQLLYAYQDSLANARTRYTLAMHGLSAWCSRIAESYRRLQELLLSQIGRHKTWVAEQRLAVIGLTGRIGQMQLLGHQQISARIASASSFLDQANPERQLKLGYAIVKSSKGKIIRSVKEVSTGDVLATQVSDGNITSLVR